MSSRGKYINIILKMEEMLKSWFPNVRLQDQPDVTQTEEAVPTKKLKVKLQKDAEKKKKAAVLCKTSPDTHTHARASQTERAVKDIWR